MKRNTLGNHPKEALIEGARILRPLLESQGFRFEFRGEGESSGGHFAWGEFLRDDRRIELHFRHSLGVVRYHVGVVSASHESYMRELGVWGQCEYPGFSEDAIGGFRELAHDFAFADEFTSGNAEALHRAAAKESISARELGREFMGAAVGDTRRREEMRAKFREKKYGEVLSLASELKYPDQLSASERIMVETARAKATPATGSDARKP